MKRILERLDYKIIIIIILSIISISLFGYYIYDINYNKVDNKKSEEKKKNNKKEETKEEVIPLYNNILPEYRTNYNNNNIVGKIEIPGILDTFVVRSSDNSYYLNRNFYNESDGIGVPFFDFRNTDLDNARQLNVYGHNSENSNILDKLPLANLVNYLDNNVYNNNKLLYLYSDNRKSLYEIIGVKIGSKSNDTHMYVEFNNDDLFINHVNDMLNGSLYKTNEEIKSTDQILVLQTCYYNPANSLVLVYFKKVKILEKS